MPKDHFAPFPSKRNKRTSACKRFSSRIHQRNLPCKYSNWKIDLAGSGAPPIVYDFHAISGHHNQFRSQTYAAPPQLSSLHEESRRTHINVTSSRKLPKFCIVKSTDSHSIPLLSTLSIWGHSGKKLRFEYAAYVLSVQW